MNNYKHQLTRNKYDNEEQAQYWIKFKHGYTAGKLMRVKEEAGV
jgi:hypothetical protein